MKVWFASGDARRAAWLYDGTNGACAIVAGGMAETKEPGTDPFADRFADAGFTVPVFDQRRLGESGGQPRQVVRLCDERADWNAAIAYPGTLPGVSPARSEIWGFSTSGGHIFAVAADNPAVAATISQTPDPDGQAAAGNAMRHQHPSSMLRLLGRGLLDVLAFVRRHPLATRVSTVAEPVR